MSLGAVNDAIILYWHLLHSSLSGGNRFWNSTLGKKSCVSEMAVEVGIFPNCLVATCGLFQGVPTIDMKQFYSFLLVMLLAFLVVWYFASCGYPILLYIDV